jgi:hypothetical protein
MSEHLWTQENLAAHVADGLEAAECERLERHIAECPGCAQALESARNLDHKLGLLFPKAGANLEYATIQWLRQRGTGRSSSIRLITSAAAASFLLGLLGWGLNYQQTSEKTQFTSVGTTIGSSGGGAAADSRHAGISANHYVFGENRGHEVGKAGGGARALAPAYTIPLNDGSQSMKESEVTGLAIVPGPPVVQHYFRPDETRLLVERTKDARIEDLDQRESTPEKRSKGTAKADDNLEREVLQQKLDVPQALAQNLAMADRKIIRSGEIEFEVDSFDGAVAVIQRLVAAAKGGFIATINSDKLANGKVRGTVVVRVPPGELDTLVLGLRREIVKAGELKGQRIGSQDVTKQYTDLESRLRAARTMEERLLKIIQEGKGVIKDLLQAEKELGTWRTRIEEMEGELRFYANQVALSTLSINLTEKEIRVAAGVVENERVQAGIEVDDVDKAYRAALTAIAEAKGHVTRSELKQHTGGQFSAILHFEVAQDVAGPVRDRLKQLGTMVRLEIDRTQHTVGGSKLPGGVKLEHGPTQFQVSLYNLANVAPRETIVARVAALDVPLAYRTLRDAISKAQGRIVNAHLNEQDRQNVVALVDFDLRRADEALPQAALAEMGETLSRKVTRVPEGENVTDAKVLYKVEIVSAVNVEPRETVTLGVEVGMVEAALKELTAQVKEAQGRVVKASESLDRNGQMTAIVTYDVPLASAPALIEWVRNAGNVRTHQMAQNQQAPSGKLAIARLDVTLSNSDLLVPRTEGLGAQLRYGLSISLRGLALSAGWLLIGLLFVLPWALLVGAAVWLARRLRGPGPQTPSTNA